VDTRETKTPIWVSNSTNHMANERTFLAWIRTSVGIMAFGFVVEKFTLFMREFTYFFAKEGVTKTDFTTQHNYAAIFGIFLVAVGVIIGFISFIKYKQIQKEIDDDTYQPSTLLPIVLTVTLFLSGVFLIYYLIGS